MLRRVSVPLVMWGWLALPVAGAPAGTPLPQGAVALVNEDHHGLLVALCADTGDPAVLQGVRKVRSTAIWIGRPSELKRVDAGTGACDPAWSPDGRRLAITSAEGLWIFDADGANGSLRVESKLPLGGPTEFSYRAFLAPRWSADGLLVAVVVTNGGTSWVEVFEAATGRLFYTSPPENDAFSWIGGRELKLRTGAIQLPTPGR